MIHWSTINPHLTLPRCALHRSNTTSQRDCGDGGAQGEEGHRRGSLVLSSRKQAWLHGEILYNCLVGGLEHVLFFHIGNSNPNWLSYFSEGLKPPTSWGFNGNIICNKELPSLRNTVGWWVLGFPTGFQSVAGSKTSQQPARSAARWYDMSFDCPGEVSWMVLMFIPQQHGNQLDN